MIESVYMAHMVRRPEVAVDHTRSLDAIGRGLTLPRRVDLTPDLMLQVGRHCLNEGLNDDRTGSRDGIWGDLCSIRFNTRIHLKTGPDDDDDLN